MSLSPPAPPQQLHGHVPADGNRRRNRQEPDQGASDDSEAKCYLIITNISKKPNVKSLLLLAAAFGCETVFVAGQKKFDFSVEGRDLPHQLKNMVRNGQMDIVKFDRLDECIAHIKSIVGAKVLGVEIDERAKDVEGEPFEGDTAIMMGNEGQGMNKKQMSLCDGFVKIAQYGGGTASLNVYVAASIVLHRFHHWARGDDVRRYCGGYDE
jgi:tRNA G18 (ribose-2'-O)-methylase SpoU